MVLGYPDMNNHWQYLASCFNFRGRKPDNNMGCELPLKLPNLSVLFSMYASPILTDNQNFICCPVSKDYILHIADRFIRAVDLTLPISKHTHRTIHSQPERYKKHATGRKDHLASKVKCNSDQ